MSKSDQRERLDTALEQAVRSIELDIERDGFISMQLSSDELTMLHEAIRRARGACLTAGTDHAQSASRALLSFGATMLDIARECATAKASVHELREQITAIEEHHRVAIDDAERRASLARERGDTAIVAAERQRDDAQHFATTSTSSIHTHLVARINACVGGVNDSLRAILDIERTLERIGTNDVSELERIEHIRFAVGADEEAAMRTLESEAAALAVDCAPFRGRARYELSETDLCALSRILDRYDRLTEQQQMLIALLAQIEQEVSSVDECLTALKRSWTEQNALRSAALRFFDCGAESIFSTFDIFALSGTTRTDVERAQQQFSDIRTRCGHRCGELRARLRGFRSRYEATTTALTKMQTEIAELRDTNDISWFDAFPIEEQETIRAALFSFSVYDEDRLSCKQITALLWHAGFLPNAERAVDVEDVVYRHLRPEFFTPAHANPDMQRKMRVFRCSQTLGVYWMEAWRRKHPDIFERLTRGLDALRQATSAEGVAKRERKSERERDRRLEMEDRKRAEAMAAAAKRSEQQRRSHPASLIQQLGTTERQLLAALIAAVDLMPKEPNASHAIKIAAAAIAVGIVQERQPQRVAQAFHGLFSCTPPLIGITTDENGQRTIGLSG
ncbi:MAG: hypothetical protein ABIG71_02445, partial [Candidatus Uhrbacteria bacterium]